MILRSTLLGPRVNNQNRIINDCWLLKPGTLTLEQSDARFSKFAKFNQRKSYPQRKSESPDAAAYISGIYNSLKNKRHQRVRTTFVS